MNDDLRMQLYDFDADIVGFDCADAARENGDDGCPFEPGCGGTVFGCPMQGLWEEMLKRLAPVPGTKQ